MQAVGRITLKVDDVEGVIRRVKSRPITIACDLIVVKDLGLKEFFIGDDQGNIIQFIQNVEPAG